MAGRGLRASRKRECERIRIASSLISSIGCAQRLAAHPLMKPSNLELEVLETSALQDVVRTSQVSSACREIGVSIGLDDFGTGYSSLTYLKRLPANVLKIDQSFVRDMLDEPENLTILEGVLGLAAAFRREVIAEGVETVEHGLMLLQMGCELRPGIRHCSADACAASCRLGQQHGVPIRGGPMCPLFTQKTGRCCTRVSSTAHGFRAFEACLQGKRADSAVAGCQPLPRRCLVRRMKKRHSSQCARDA